MADHILEMRCISKAFGGLQALDSVSIDLKHGEVLGLVGDNAAGKSTLMKIVTGTYTADGGDMVFDGRLIERNNPKVAKTLGIEMVYQNLQLCPNLDVPANLYLGREIRHGAFLSKHEMEADSRRILATLKINLENLRMRVDRLSGGQQQAVAIGKAVSFHPKVVIMDEPTANLAQKEIGKVLELMLSLKAHGISSIMISHRLEDIFAVADRIVVLRQGRKVAERRKDETDRKEILSLMFD